MGPGKPIPSPDLQQGQRIDPRLSFAAAAAGGECGLGLLRGIELDAGEHPPGATEPSGPVGP